MDKNGYPTEEELKKIEKWDFIKDKNLRDFLDYVKDLWSYPDRFVLTGKKVLKLYLSTGGWSGNEDVLEALTRNFAFWALYWVKSERGGHYWFEIPLSIEGKKEIGE